MLVFHLGSDISVQCTYQFTVVFHFVYDFEIPWSVSHIINVKTFHLYIVHNCLFFSTVKPLPIIPKGTVENKQWTREDDSCKKAF
jgi:hypothetical protein